MVRDDSEDEVVLKRVWKIGKSLKSKEGECLYEEEEIPR